MVAAADAEFLNPQPSSPHAHIRRSPAPSGELRSGRGDRIRTYDLLVPNQALYQAKLHPDTARIGRVRPSSVNARVPVRRESVHATIELSFFA